MARGGTRRRVAPSDKASKTCMCLDAAPAPRGGAQSKTGRTAPVGVDDRKVEAELLQAIETLYDDMLRPYGRIVRKRLTERRQEARPDTTASFEPHGKDLRALCERSSKVRVVSEQGGEWAALLLDRKESFVDIYSDVDCYPPRMWQAAKVYFDGLVGSPSNSTDGTSVSGALHGGRYASARELLQRKPDFLQGRSFGEVCHIMELAISQKSLLGYCNGAVVPYSQSTSMKKSLCADKQQPCSGSIAGTDAPKVRGASEYEVADWQKARERLRQVLDEAVAAGQNQVPLSNVKRIFRSKFHLELSETALGHAKISTLLLDANFRDICTVELQDHGYVVVPVSGVEVPPAPLLLEDKPIARSEQRFFSTSASDRTALDSTPGSVFYSTPASGRAGLDSTTSSARWAALSPSFLTPEGGLVRATFIHADLPPVTPTGPSARKRCLSMPKDHGSDRDALEAAYISLRPVDSPSSALIQKDISVEASASVPTPTQKLSAQGSRLAARVRPPMALDDDDLFGNDDLAPIGEHSQDGSANFGLDGALDGTPEFVHFTPSNAMFVPKTPLWEEGYAFDGADLGLQAGGFFANFPKRTPSPKGYTSPKGETFIDADPDQQPGDYSFGSFPMRTPSPTWATHKYLLGRAPASPMGFSQSFDTPLSLGSLSSSNLAGGASFAFFSP